MTHEFALYLIETLIAEYGDSLVVFALENSVTLFPEHKQKLLEALGPQMLLSRARELLTPPQNREEIEGHPCRNCGGTDCETMLVFTGFQKTDAWFCKTCQHYTIMPPKSESEQDNSV